MFDKQEYEQLVPLSEKYRKKAEEVFETWAAITGTDTTQIVHGIAFFADRFEVTHDCDGYGCICTEKLPLEYLFSDTWADELTAKVKLKKEEAVKEAALKELWKAAGRRRILNGQLSDQLSEGGDPRSLNPPDRYPPPVIRPLLGGDHD